MAAGRKLQAEIEKALKKVDEGIEEFHQLWDNVHSACQPNQREKFETDLKTQIKKLQREREQVKVWLGDKSLKKNESALMEARKKIEAEMERFKDFERDVKTKTYSKYGLLKTDNMDPAEERRQQQRAWLQSSMDTLTVQIDEFEAEQEVITNKKSKSKSETQHVEKLKEAQERHRWHIRKLDQLVRKLDNDDVSLDELEDLKDGVNYYVEENQNPDFYPDEGLYDQFNLEEVKDYLEKDDSNVAVATEAAKAAEPANPAAGIQSSADPKVVPKEIARKLSDDPKAKGKGPPSVPVVPPGSLGAKPIARAKDPPTSESEKPWQQLSVWQNPQSPILDSGKAGVPLMPPMTPGPQSPQNAPEGVPGMPGVNLTPGSVPPKQMPRPAPTLPPPMQPAPDRPSQAGQTMVPPSQPPPKPAPQQAPQIQPPSQAPPQPPMPNAPAPPSGNPPRPPGEVAPSGGPGSGPLMPPPPMMAPPAPHDAPPSGPVPAAPEGQSLTAPPTQAPPPPPPSLLPPPPPGSATGPGQPPSTTPSVAGKKMDSREPPAGPPPGGPPPAAGYPAASRPNDAPPPPPGESPPPPPESGEAGWEANDGAMWTSAAPTVAAVAASLSGPSNSAGQQIPLANTKANAQPDGAPPTQTGAHSTTPEAGGPLSPRKLQMLQSLSVSHRNMPTASDGQRNRKYMPRNPYVHQDTKGNVCYPTNPTPNYDNPAMFEKYDLDTLFFVFYYQQGSYQQHLAAKELKKLSWRYHTKYLTWFQRHEEPRMTTADFERGTYVYFDHDTGWCQRIKSDFTFEYQFLEDEQM